ncbi:MAG: NAD-dependent epimerase/dehydratase family protein [Bacteroidota bacterium]
MKILVTGAAGFIGFHITLRLLKNGHEVIGLDNLSNYYSVQLKLDRLKQLGIDNASEDLYNRLMKSQVFKRFRFICLNLEDRQNLPFLFQKEKFQVVCNLAAQAGVRYSIKQPLSYIDSNIVGFHNVLESCRNYDVDHLVYASSSSVYGLKDKMPFETSDFVDQPISLYAATKKSNELMAHAYSHLYNFMTTGLRFFTVYGPWGRPDMAIFLFTEAIMNGTPIEVFNNGNLERDFTFIDDITEGVIRVIESSEEKRKTQGEYYKIYNIGNNRSVNLLEFIATLEKSLNKSAIKKMLPMQPGDVTKTWANVDGLIADYGYRPLTPLKIGVESFVKWYLDYYHL